MFEALQVASVLLVAVTMALALAHALELPGKLRLSKQEYIATQTIYYPGFTFGGLAEAGALIALLVLVLLTPESGAVFWLRLAALIAMVALHAVYWLITHPVNNFWLKDVQLRAPGARFFFGIGRAHGAGRAPDWTALRGQWERSHILRAGLGVTALVLLTTSLVV